jgi:hypothetical protein
MGSTNTNREESRLKKFQAMLEKRNSSPTPETLLASAQENRDALVAKDEELGKQIQDLGEKMAAINVDLGSGKLDAKALVAAKAMLIDLSAQATKLQLEKAAMPDAIAAAVKAHGQLQLALPDDIARRETDLLTLARQIGACNEALVRKKAIAPAAKKAHERRMRQNGTLVGAVK